MAKINGGNARIDIEGTHSSTKFRLLENMCMEMTNDSMLGII
jgi:Ni2+-binding GTPase involved in maturation of urease and hydrogenase